MTSNQLVRSPRLSSNRNVNPRVTDRRAYYTVITLSGDYSNTVSKFVCEVKRNAVSSFYFEFIIFSASKKIVADCQRHLETEAPIKTSKKLESISQLFQLKK